MVHRRYELIVLLVAAVIFLGTAISPPRLMDDTDAVNAQIARNMLDSGDWVTARLNGVAYLEKSPLLYWMMAASYAIFGVHDWAARLPVALSAIALAWLVCRMGFWAFNARAGLHAGLAIATSIGLWLFTRIQIPDVVLTLTIALAMWGFLRALDENEPRPRMWAAIMAASIGAGLLLKGLIAAVFPVAAAAIYLAIRREFPWRRLHIWSGLLIILAIAAPWHIIATLRNPPYFDLTMKSEPGRYHGFFWFYFLNEHLFRFLNMRYPRDYNTVPRPLFWLLHLVWFFPWSVYFGNAFGRVEGERGSRMRLLCLCWIGFVMGFFTLSTTQEYYSMPIYPAAALLLGLAIDRTRSRWPDYTVRAVAVAAAVAIVAILVRVWNLPAPGDISNALTQHPEAYTLSMGHMGDLTIDSFAYLKLPLIVAGIAFIIGAAGRFAAMMVVLFHAARLALIVFDPYLGSYALAQALKQSPPGWLIVDNQYYAFSSVFFYANDRSRGALLLNGRVTNLEYGSYAPGAPAVFVKDPDLPRLWSSPDRYYLVFEKPELERITRLVGRPAIVLASGGKFLAVNHAGRD